MYAGELCAVHYGGRDEGHTHDYFVRARDVLGVVHHSLIRRGGELILGPAEMSEDGPEKRETSGVVDVNLQGSRWMSELYHFLGFQFGKGNAVRLQLR